MSVGLYMDEHVPRPITDGLRRRGIDVLTAQEDHRDGFPDDELISRATELTRVLFSQDQDMLREAGARMATGELFSGIAYADQLGITISQAIDSLELLARVCDPPDMEGRVEYLPF